VLWARMGRKRHVLHGPDPPWEGAIPVDKGGSHCKV